MQNSIWNNENLIKVLKNKGVVVMPTDTIYGIVGEALDKDVVEHIYKVRKRNPEKPFIVLIGSIDELDKFSINLTEKQKNVFQEYWPFGNTQDFQPRATSIILDCVDDSLEYLHRGTKTLAFRVPAQQQLRDLLLEVGPLIAPSANPEALLPAKNINEAKEYFGDCVDLVRSKSPQGDCSTRFARAASNGVDLYIDGGEIEAKASRLIKLNVDGSVVVLRE